MKRFIILLLIAKSLNQSWAQSCEEIIEFVKQEGGYGATYTSFQSDAIAKVTFYELLIDYQTVYFAIVCFKREFQYGCSEYIYQVGTNTKFNYSLHYMDSAGKAFWEYIQPYNENLGCAPEFE